MNEKILDSITFNFLEPEKVRALSAVEITTAQTYDIDGFPYEGGLMDLQLGVMGPGLRCKTCNQRLGGCPGHFGHLEMIRPVIHTKYAGEIRKILNSVCPHCSKMMLDSEARASYQKDFDETLRDTREVGKEIERKLKKVKVCPHCNHERDLLKHIRPQKYMLGDRRLFPNDIREILVKVSDDDFELLGYNAEGNRPEWWILTVLAVPPVTMRPSIALESGTRSEDDLTHMLSNIIRTNQRLKENINAGAPQIIIENMWDLLQYNVTVYFDNTTSGVPPANDRSGKPLRTLMQRLSGKQGRFRLNLSGKRVDFAARTVVTPDPNISINELGVPKKIATVLSYPEHVTEWNIEELRKYVSSEEYPQARSIKFPDGTRKRVMDMNREELTAELVPGCIIERDVIDGDITVFNRQPSLHRASEMAHKIKILPDRTFRLHPCVTAPYNADFDGDEMNLHFPQGPEPKTEARELMIVEKQVVSPRHGGPIICVKEDWVAGAAILTLPNTYFTKSQAMTLAQLAGVNELPKAAKKDLWAGKDLFSLIIPDNVNVAFKSASLRTLEKLGVADEKITKEYTVIIEKGEIKTGIIDKAAIGQATGVLLQEIARNNDYETIRIFYDRMTRVITTALNIKGITLSETEYVSDPKVKAKLLSSVLKNGEKLVQDYKDGSMESLPGLTYEKSFEYNMINLAEAAQEEVTFAFLREKLKELTNADTVSSSLFMMLTGARANIRNLMNISGLQGQTTIMNDRPKEGYGRRILPSFKNDDLGLQANGFVTHNLIEGLTPKEFFFNAMGGRIGEIEGSNFSVKASGYLQRQTIHAAQDLRSMADLTVRAADGNIIQFMYGDDGLFTNKTKLGQPFTFHELMGDFI